MGAGATTLELVALFAAAGLLMRLLDRWEPGGVRPESARPRQDLPGLAVTADGQRLFETPAGVQILPPGDVRSMWPVRAPSGLDWNLLVFQVSSAVDPRTHARVPSWVPGTQLVPGDLVGARLLESPRVSEPPWRLEALGRDRDYRAWSFDQEADARAALDMLERRVVRRLPFDSGPWPPGPGEYERALRERAETEREALAALTGWTWSVAGSGDGYTR